MSAAIIEEDGDTYVPIGQRPEWTDVAPLSPPAASQHVVSIARDQQFGDLMNYFWAAVEAKEMSARVLALTEEIILELNSANYTVWEWRWRCIQALGGIEMHAAGEEGLLQRVAHENPKNYQLWNHRRRFALARGAQHVEQELVFAAESLAFDAKNYHAWAHRQAVLAAFGGSEGCIGGSKQAKANGGLWEQELAFTECLLRDDVRNNSAWNQRFFVLARAPAGQLPGTPSEVFDREVDFVLSKLRAVPHNESAWGYLRGLAQLPSAPRHTAVGDVRWRQACEGALAREPSCAPALELLVDIYAQQAALLDQQASNGEAAAGSSGEKELVRAAGVARRLAGQLLEKLAVVDPIRAPGYYHYRQQLLSEGA